MIKSFTKLLRFVFLFLVLTGFGMLNSYGQEYKNGVLQGTIRIKIKPTLGSAVKISKSASTGIVTTGIQELDRLNRSYSVTEMKRVFRYSPQFEEKHKKYGLDLWYDITVAANTSSTEVVKGYAKLQEIQTAEPILEKRLIDGSTKPIYLPKSDKGTNSEYFNDPYLAKQWHYNNTGQSGGTPGSDINAYNAWNIEKGSKNVIVSIHDMGVDVKHEDLKDAMWINQAEFNGVAGVDDDGNGYKDDIYGFNFSSNMGTIDAGYHATHVAGTVGAVNNNGIGVSGIAGGSGTADGVRIMSCEILGGTGSGNTPDSYIYAADMGAVISQNSWGYSYPDFYEQSVLDAIDYFIAEAGSYAGSPMKGGVVIFAAGNSAIEGASYPGYYDHCIAVAALNASSNLTVYSNYGTWVDIAAPGGQAEDNANIDPNSEYKNGVLSTLDHDSYGFMDGTSMACPHVSGVAALVVSKFGGPIFTNNDLKNRLLTGTRFLDTIPENQAYAGKLGSGSIDAVLALAINNNMAPNQITDLQLNGIAQDFATVSWTVPADNDDAKPVSFEVIYSTTPISNASMQLAKIIKINSRLEPGNRDTLEINYLKPLTKYYFSVQSIDRWGNKSDFSNLVTGTTNAGPDAQIDPNVSALDITVDVSVNAVESNSFDLLNHGEGMLKWDAATHHQYAYPSSVQQIRYPVLQTIHSTNGRNLMSSKLGEIGHPVTLAIDNPADTSLGYVNGWNLWVIGETDTTYTNSSATRFRVTDAKGFNLTNIDAFLVHKEATGSIVLEVYEGENIGDAKIVYKQEVDYSSDYGYTSITLNDRIFFEQGKVFWIVFHVPSMNLYPLGAGLETHKEDSKNCFYSTDLGKTWNLFEDVYYDNQLVWAVFAGSKYADIGKYISLSPESGTVESAASTSIAASVDGTKMINGSYTAAIVISTNETDEPLLRLPVNLTIKAQKPIIKSARRIDAGSVLIGNEKTVEVKLQNTGLGRFQFESYGYDANWNSIYFNLSNPQFTYVSGLNSYFEAGTEQTVKFKLKPTQQGNIASVVTMKDDKSNTYSFELIGFGVDPPVMALSPADTTITGLSIGDTIKGSFYLKNEGKYPLDYFAPAFSDGSNMAEIPATIHKFGYQSSINPAGIKPEPAYNWTDISTTGIEVSKNLSSDADRFLKVDIGFEFPFFGKNESSVYISRYSTLSFDTEGYIWSSSPLRYGWEGLPDRIISVLGIFTPFEDGGHIYYQRFQDKFIVQWQDASLYGMGIGTYQAVLHDNGNINVYLKDVTATGWATLENISSSSYIGIEDQTRNDGLRVSDYNLTVPEVISAGSSVEFVSPGQGLYASLTNPAGTVQAGESIKLDYTINTDKLYVAQYTEKLVLITNDPFNNPGLFTTNFNITSGGDPHIIASTESLAFGQVFQNDIKKEIFFLADTGKAATSIQTAEFKHGFYTINGSFPEVLKPGRAVFHDVSINTSTIGVFADTLVITTSEGMVFEIALSGEVIEAPKISANLTEINETLPSGGTKTLSLVITNDGNHDLDFAPAGNSWMNISLPAITKVPEIPDYTYQFKSSTEAGGPEFNWTEIGEEPNKISVGELWNGESPWSSKIDLPFTFSYYGKEYDFVYVGYNGIISFTDGQELNPFGGTAIPDTEVPNNFIAPFYGFIGASWIEEYPKTGYYVKSSDDKVIVEFREFNTGFGMTGPISVQVILYKTGNIKFQYKMANDSEGDIITSFGVIGVENFDGSEGVQIADHNSKNRSKTAYELSPVTKYVVPAGTAKQFDVTLNATELYAGTYTANLALLNNAPSGQGLSIPVTLTVSGSAELLTPSSVELGDILVLETPGNWGSTFKSYDKTFEFENKGSAKAEILQFDVSKLLTSTVYASVLAQDWFGNWTYQWMDVANLPATDWNTGLTVALYLQPKSVLQFKASITPQMAGEVKDTLTVITDYGTFVIPVNGNAFTPPALVTDPDTVQVYAQLPTHFETKSVLLQNTEGGYKLGYTTTIEYNRAVKPAAASADPQLLSLYSATPVFGSQKLLKSKRRTTKSTTDYNRQLSYESATEAETGLGYGGSSAFYTLTAFKAPADGFNLTHVQTWYVAGAWLNSKIKVQVYAGSSDIYKAQLIHSQVYNYTIPEATTAGEMLTIALDQNLKLYPNESFYVVFGYESGATYPQGVNTMPAITKNRYMYSNGSGAWNDIAEEGASLKNFGWMVRALEQQFVESAWVTLNSASTDTIAAGNTGEIALDFSASSADPGDNYANLTITSNDPVHSKKKVTLLLHLNQGPQFDVKKTSLQMNEGETLNFQIAATDREKDNFTTEMLSSHSFVSHTVTGNTFNITCTPTFDDAGIYLIKVGATDEFGNKNEATISVTVKNVNRAPEVVNPVGNSQMMSTEMPILSLSEIISDPDGDLLKYTAKSSDESVVKLFMADDAVILTAKSSGTSTITLTGTDSEGLSATHSYTVTVLFTGINENESSSFIAYPNPTKGEFKLFLTQNLQTRSLVQVTDLLGSVLLEAKPAAGQNPVNLDISKLANGVYLVKVNNDGVIKTMQVIKN